MSNTIDRQERFVPGWRIKILILLCWAAYGSEAFAHKGPDPLARWVFDSVAIKEDKLVARLGPDGKLSGRLSLVKDDFGESLQFTGWTSTLSTPIRR